MWSDNRFNSMIPYLKIILNINGLPGLESTNHQTLMKHMVKYKLLFNIRL